MSAFIRRVAFIPRSKCCMSMSLTRAIRFQPSLYPLPTTTASILHSQVDQMRLSSSLPNANTNTLGKMRQKSDTLEDKQVMKMHINMLRMSHQRSGRILYGDLHGAIRILKRVGVCFPDQAVTLLQSCGQPFVDEKPSTRTQLALELWKFFEDAGVPLDVSHYNTLLNTHVENGHNFSPTDYLAWMEEKSISPNRVTFQHMIAKYCQDGNIAEATHLLQHMKEKDMPINEYIFHSLMTGHCMVNDVESAKKVMQVMKDSGLMVGADTHGVLLKGMVKAGCSFDDIKKSLAEFEEQESITFDDKNLLELILELSKSKQVDAARELVDSLPMKAGSFQEMRNIVPNIIFAGEHELALKIFQKLQVTTPGIDTQDEKRYRNNGLFFLRAMILMNASSQTILEFVEPMIEFNPQIVARVVEAYIDNDQPELGKEFKELAISKFGMECSRNDYYQSYIRIRTNDLVTDEELQEFARKLRAARVLVFPSMISLHFMPKLFAQPRKIIDACNVLSKPEDDSLLSFANVINGAIQFKLNQENLNSFKDVAFLSLNVKFPANPRIWNASLARSYLATDSLDNFVAVIFSMFHLQSQSENETFRHEALFSVVHVIRNVHSYPSAKSNSDRVLEMLQKLKEMQIGFPPEMTSLLNGLQIDEDAKQVVNELSELGKENQDYWTADTIAKAKKRILDKISKRETIQVRKESLPDDLPGLQNLRQEMNSATTSQQTTQLVERKIMEILLQENQLREAETVLRRMIKNKCGILAEFDRLVSQMLQNGEMDAVISLTNDVVNSDRYIYSSTMEQVFLTYIANNDDLSALKPIAENLRKEALIGTMKRVSGRLLERAEDPLTEEIRQILEKKGLVEAMPEAYEVSRKIKDLVNNGQVEEAVTLFEKSVSEDKVLPTPHFLMPKLIETEDMERMQRVLNASISLVGEERSLYDMAMNFLIMGKFAQAKKLLETPGLRYQQHNANYICNKLRRENNIVALEAFVKLTRNLFACDREELYTHLVSACHDDAEKILELWLTMQEENFSPSMALRRRMAKYLEKGGKQVPFQVKTTSPKKSTSAETEESGENIQSQLS